MLFNYNKPFGSRCFLLFKQQFHTHQQVMCKKSENIPNKKLSLRRSSLSPSARLDSLSKSTADSGNTEAMTAVLPEDSGKGDQKSKASLPPRFRRRTSLSPMTRVQGLIKDNETKEE